MRDIIHIGFPRTASSWFQQVVFPRVQNYTFIPRSSATVNLISPIPGEYNPDWTLKYRDKNLPLLLSEEMITGRIRAGSSNLFFLETYAQRIKDSFNNPIIIVFLRRQPESIFSFYNLYIKKGGTYSFSDFLRQDLSLQKSLLFSPDFFCYDKSLEILRHAFDRESIKIFLYEDFATHPTKFIEQFCSELALEVNSSVISFNPVNSSYAPFERILKRSFNYFTRQGIPFKHYLINLPWVYNLIKEGKNCSSKIPKRFNLLLEPMMPAFIASNQKLITNYGLLHVKDHNYPL